MLKRSSQEYKDNEQYIFELQLWMAVSYCTKRVRALKNEDPILQRFWADEYSYFRREALRMQAFNDLTDGVIRRESG